MVVLSIAQVLIWQWNRLSGMQSKNHSWSIASRIMGFTCSKTVFRVKALIKPSTAKRRFFPAGKEQGKDGGSCIKHTARSISVLQRQWKHEGFAVGGFMRADPRHTIWHTIVPVQKISTPDMMFHGKHRRLSGYPCSRLWKNISFFFCLLAMSSRKRRHCSFRSSSVPSLWITLSQDAIFRAWFHCCPSI